MTTASESSSGHPVGTAPAAGTATAGPPPPAGSPTAGPPPPAGSPTAGPPPPAGTATAGPPPPAGTATAGLPPPAGGAPDGSQPLPAPPGTATVRRRTRIDWELIDCGLNGHSLVGTDAAQVRPDDQLVVRETDGLRWYRCLRCDAWTALAPPADPTRPTVPSRDEIQLPLRGSALRDRFVLRLIALERVVHIVVLTLLVVAILLFAANKNMLRDDYTRILADLQGTFGGTIGKQGILADINRLFAVQTVYLYLVGIALAAYTAVLCLETVGLWLDRRWAEYLTFVETSVLVPYEIYELTHGVTALKALGLALNLLILSYLALAHRLFGLRGGLAALEARRAVSNSWEAIERATPGLPGDVAGPTTDR